jgi:diguanylate cyclase (GGDEF)-like protein
VIEDQKSINKKINNLFKIIFILVISGISIFFIALFLLRKKVLIPIEYLMDIINKIKTDNKDYEKIIFCNDEIGAFTEQLFEMKEQRDRDFEKLKELSITDPLTGIKNRRSFFEISEKFFKLAKRKELALSIIMLDIDFFKKVNDTYGHIIGDEILKFLVQIVDKELRDSDIFARYGGEEFIIMLPDTTLDGAFKTANKLRKIIEDTPYEGDVEVPITISLGVAQLKNEKIFNDLIIRADDALYKAKDSGRNIAIKSE